MSGRVHNKDSFFRISVDSHDLDRASVALRQIKGGVEKATMRALNRASMGAKTEIVRQAKAEYHVKTSRVRETLTVKKASMARLEASVHSRGARLPLSRFRLRPQSPPNQAGIRVASRRRIKAAVKRSTTPVRFDRAFIARFRSGHVGAFQRIRGEKTRKGRPKMRELYSLSVPQMVGRNEVASLIGEVAEIRLVKELDHQIDRLLGKDR